MRKYFLLSLLLLSSIITGCNDTIYVHEDRDETTPGTAFPMSIHGNGFFVIRDQETEELKYTKMGNFYLSPFNNINYLVDPYANRVQGWNTDINGDISSSITDIIFLPESEPMESSRITVITNLDKDENSKSPILSNEWDGTAIPPIISSSYKYKSTINVYDVDGETHEITIYYDKISNAEWEYIVTCNPTEDLRAGIEGTEAAGLLARGRISFNEASGTITGLTMSKLTGYTVTPGIDQAVQCTNATGGFITTDAGITVNNSDILTGTAPATVTLSYTAISNTWVTSAGNVVGSSNTGVSINLGGTSTADITVDLPQAATANGTFTLILTRSDDWTLLTSNDFNQDGYPEFETDFYGGTATSQDIALDIGLWWNGSSFKHDALSTTQYASASVSVFKSSDGNGIEALASLTIDENGLIIAHYLGGTDIPLFMVSLARFIAPNELQAEDNFIYSETEDSGSAIISMPGINGTGYIVQGGIEDDPTFTDELFPQTRIDGQGFFIVRNQDNNNRYYTRSGEFNFNKDGILSTPEGYIVQGWGLDVDGNITGSITDIVKTVFTSQPQPTDSISVITNLGKDRTSNSMILSSAWDATQDPPIAATNYEYQTTVKAYDSLGSTHDVTVYYDKISIADWEYIVTCNPAEDLRAGIAGTEAAGLLARGRISFNESNGTITDITMSRLTGYTMASAGTNQAVICTTATGGFRVYYPGITVNNPDILKITAPATVTLTYNATTNTWATSAGNIVSSLNTGISINLGGSAAADITVDLPQAATANGTMTLTLTRSNDWTVLTAADFNPEGYFEFMADFLGGAATTQNISLNMGVKWNGSSFVPDSLSTTQYGSASTTVYQSANGYDAGIFMSDSVDESGIIHSSYSNSVTRKDWQIAVATFAHPNSLVHYAGNIYRETARSGSPVVGLACTDDVNCITVSE